MLRTFHEKYSYIIIIIIIIIIVVVVVVVVIIIIIESRDSSVIQRWATGWMIGEFESGQGLGIFLFTTVSIPALGPTQPPIQWVPGAPSLGIKRPRREADHSLPSSAEIKECVELYLHSPNTPSWRGAQLKHRDNFTFTFTTDMFIPLSNVIKLLGVVMLVHCLGDNSVYVPLSCWPD
jgi:hypothetical protein